MLHNCDAAILYILGQSNAHAHGLVLPERDRITVPLKNVFALDRDPNQSFVCPRAVWSGYTTAGKNLGETQDHTPCLAYYAALGWQAAIDRGERLPDLYIVQISIGSQGLVNGMWNMRKPQVLHPGVLGEADISLYPLALRTLRLVHSDLSARFRNPAVLGLHWLGSEEDAQDAVCALPDFYAQYETFFASLREAAGFPCPLYFYRLVCLRREGVTPGGLAAVNGAFGSLCALWPDARMTGADESPLWDLRQEALGVFGPDQVHYTAQAQQWFAGRLLAACGAGR